MSDNFNMYDQANQQGNPNIPPMPPMEEKKGMSIASMVLTTESLVTDAPEPKSCGCGNNHEMDNGMNGMY